MPRKKKTERHKSKTPGARLPWQTGEYSRQADFTFVIPYEFLLLTKILQTTPRAVLRDFMQQISFLHSRSETVLTQKLLDFMAAKYGAGHFSSEQMELMFGELGCMNGIDLKYADERLLQLHERWKDAMMDDWFLRWERVRQNQKPANSRV